jgi:hypothetical protein
MIGPVGLLLVVTTDMQFTDMQFQLQFSSWSCQNKSYTKTFDLIIQSDILSTGGDRGICSGISCPTYRVFDFTETSDIHVPQHHTCAKPFNAKG